MFPLSSVLADTGNLLGAVRSLDLPAQLLRELVQRARAGLPEECCGILIGSETGFGRARVARAIAVQNTASYSRTHAYRLAPLVILEAQRRAREDGLEIVGYYHSHPSGSAAPSALDRRDAWPDISYVILGMRGGELADVKSWRLSLDGAGFVEEELNCAEDER